MNICTLVKSCKKERMLWDQIYKNHPSKIYIYYGDESIKKDEICDKNIILKCDDTWHGLREKNTRLFKLLTTTKDLEEFTHFFIIDFPESIYHANEIYNTLRGLEFKFRHEKKNNKKHYFVNEDISSKYNDFYFISLNDCNYLTDYVYAPQPINGFDYRTSYYHIEKTSKNNSKSFSPIDGPNIAFAPGSGTLFSYKSIQKISSFLLDSKNKTFIDDFYGGLHEDILMGHILSTFKIYPSIFPFNIYMRNFDNNFPELKKRFISLFEENKVLELNDYVDIFRDSYIGKDNQDYLNDQSRTINLLRLINDLKIPKFSTDSLTLQLIILVQNTDSKGFNNLVKEIIDPKRKKMKGFTKNIIILSRLIYSKKLSDFYVPLIDLIESSFPEYNFKYQLKAEILIKAKDNTRLLDLLIVLDKIKNLDAEIIKFKVLSYLITHNFSKSLGNYLGTNYDFFASQKVMIDFYLENKDFKKALGVFNKLRPRSKMQLHQKQRFSLVISKQTGDPNLCIEILKTMDPNEKDDISERIRAKIIIYLCQNGYGKTCSEFLKFNTNQFVINLCKSLYLKSQGEADAAVCELRKAVPITKNDKEKKYFFLSKFLFNISFEESKEYALQYAKIIEKEFSSDINRINKKEILLERYNKKP